MERHAGGKGILTVKQTTGTDVKAVPLEAGSAVHASLKILALATVLPVILAAQIQSTALFAGDTRR
jgi:hypothetical protein